MVIKRFTRIMVVLAIIYFQVMLMSHVFFHLGTTSNLSLKRKLLKISHYFMPIDHYPSYEYAYSYLDRGVERHDKDLLNQGIQWFKTSLSINPFYYYSHYYLGKAYYFYHFPGGDFFDDTFASLKRSALLNDHDSDIVVDLSKIVLSMWPHLEDQDKMLCMDLLKETIDKLDERDFYSIIESWNQYSRDKEVLRMILKDNKALHGKAAAILARIGGPLDLRWELLSGYEQYLFEEVRNQMKSLTFAEKASEIELVALLDQLKKIEGYGRLTNGGWTPGTGFNDLVSDLMMKRIEVFLSSQGKKLPQRSRKKLFRQTLQYIERLEHYKNLEEIRTLLNKYSYFDSNDLEAIFIKFFLEYKQGNHLTLIPSIEEFKTRASETDIQKKRKYLDILLLLTDSLEASKLLSVENRQIREMLEIFPEELSIAWRLMKVQRILGIREEEKTLDENLIEKVKNSRFFTLGNHSIFRKVFFLEEPELSLNLSLPPGQMLDTNALFRILVDDSIVLEVYAKDLKSSLDFRLPGKEYSSVEVRVDILVFNNSTVL